MKNKNGFSLVELLIVITLTAIIAIFFLPLRSNIILQTHEDALKNQLSAAIEYAQQQAQVKGYTVSLCARKDKRHCGSDWNQGQIIFVDPKGNGKITKSSDVIFLLPNQKVAGTLHFRSARSLTYVSFDSSEDDANNGTFYFCSPGKQKSDWAIAVNARGRARDTNAVVCDAGGYPTQH